MNGRTALLAGLGCAAIFLAEGAVLGGLGSETVQLLGQSMSARAGWGAAPRLTIGAAARDGVALARAISGAVRGRP